MKKIISVIIVCLVSLSTYAQVEHMKFMGIPLDGNISAFQQKLKSKGVEYNSNLSSRSPAGVRAFKGVFSGEEANIYVYYNAKTKTVYRAKAVLTIVNESIADNKFDKFASMLKEKYLTGVVTDGEQEGKPAISIKVLDQNFDKCVGFIGLYMSKDETFYTGQMFLHIDYEDAYNSIKDINKNMDDL